MEQHRNYKRYNVTLLPETKEAAMELLRDEESLSGIVQGFLEKFVARRTKNGKKKARKK